MADDPKPDPKPNPDPKPDPKDLEPDPDAGAKKALDNERKARRDAEKALADVQAKLKGLEDKDKSDTEKLRDEVAKLTKERDDHATAALRAEIAMTKGLTPGQAKRLVGSTREELETDADELVTDLGGGTGDKKPTPDGRPKEQLRGGGDPTEEPEETDPRKLAAQVPRI